MATTRAVAVIRVAVAVICVIAIVLLAGLWGRSFTYNEELVWRATDAKPFGIWSGVGRIVLTLHPRHDGGVGVHYLGPWDQSSRWHSTRQRLDRVTQTMLGFGVGTISNGEFRLMVPHWFPMFLAAGVAAAFWIISSRFWLRTGMVPPR